MSDPASAPTRIVCGDEVTGERLDAFLAKQLPRYSRVQIRRAIDAGVVTVDGKQAKPAYRLFPGQVILFEKLAERPTGPQPEPIELNLVYEDQWLAVVNKPAGMVVHPAKGHWEGTLTAALAYHFQELSSIGGEVRPGIVHRLDRDTTGLIVVAKTDEAHLKLAAQFEARTIDKQYLAIVAPPPDRDQDWIDKPIGPHPYQRERMAIREHHEAAREARTRYLVEERLGRIALVRVFPKTGRTHQIRVHLAHIGCPIIADRLYAGQSRFRVCDLSPQRTDETELIARQALHAAHLGFLHPSDQRKLEFEAPLPDDMAAVLKAARAQVGGAQT